MPPLDWNKNTRPDFSLHYARKIRSDQRRLAPLIMRRLKTFRLDILHRYSPIFRDLILYF